VDKLNQESHAKKVLAQRALLALNYLDEQERNEFDEWRMFNKSKPIQCWPKWPQVFERICS
jgi:hypothetical protein